MINFCIFHDKAEAPQGFTSGCAECARLFADAPKPAADDVFAEGRKAERALIAGWLRSLGGEGEGALAPGHLASGAAARFAESIERGDHLENKWLGQQEGEISRFLKDYEKVRKERDEALAKYQFMVDRAADEKLDGYRELASRLAAAENERDEAIRQAKKVGKP